MLLYKGIPGLDMPVCTYLPKLENSSEIMLLCLPYHFTETIGEQR